jgi:hypothetical protein
MASERGGIMSRKTILDKFNFYFPKDNDTGKQIAKKIVIRPGNRTIYMCPFCDMPVPEGSEHCYYCKRKIDWSVGE